MHEDDIDAGTASVERKLSGRDPVELVPGLLAIPTPGHTEGHVCYLWQEKFLFTGDHLAWDPDARALEAFRDYTWYSWPELVRSMERLLEYRFEWVLPGHGWRWRAESAGEMRAALERLVQASR
jgi:glyoxylase-like metal-dependent hydrolase (beta-lactamase superfamily II)